MALSPQEAHLINRFTEPQPEYDPLRSYVAVYRWGGTLHLSGIAFTSQIAAWTKPRGPHVSKDLEVVDVIDVKYVPTVTNGEQT
jgi:hypothetical protein